MQKKNVDKHNRFRSLTVAFRVSPEENEQKRKTWFNADFFKVRWLLVLYDFILFAIMGVCMTFLYKRCIKTPSSHKQFLLTLLVIYGVLFIVRFLFTIYRQVWRYGGVESYIRLYISDTIACVLFYLGERLLMRTHVSFIWLLKDGGSAGDGGEVAQGTFKDGCLAFVRCPTLLMNAFGFIAINFANIAYISWAPKFAARKFGLSIGGLLTSARKRPAA